jgi:hypothetical protein
MSQSKRNPKLNPKPGDRLVQIRTVKGCQRRNGFTGVFSRTVLDIEPRWPRGTTVVWTRKLARNPCRCSLTEWRKWAKNAS